MFWFASWNWKTLQWFCIIWAEIHPNFNCQIFVGYTLVGWQERLSYYGSTQQRVICLSYQGSVACFQHVWFALEKLTCSICEIRLNGSWNSVSLYIFKGKNFVFQYVAQRLLWPYPQPQTTEILQVVMCADNYKKDYNNYSSQEKEVLYIL